jgi:hypothetical protein
MATALSYRPPSPAAVLVAEHARPPWPSSASSSAPAVTSGEILRLSLLAQEVRHRLHFLVLHERTVQTHQPSARATGHIEHVALAQQLLGALLAQDRAAVDLAR